MHSRVGAVSRLLFVDLLGSIAWFPVWWYTRGFSLAMGWVMGRLRYRIRAYALGIWIRNFFVPMYGQYDWAGRLVSVFMRFVVLIGRSAALGVEAIVYAVGILLWVIALPLLASLIVLNVLSGIVVWP